MFWLKDLQGLFMSVSLGYVLCVLAKKQKGVLKSTGYAIGISILVISLLGGLLASGSNICPMGKMGPKGPMMGAPMSKGGCPMAERHHK